MSPLLLMQPPPSGPDLTTVGGIFSAIFSLVILGLAVFLYFLPTVAAVQRQHPNAAAIGALNFFLGWTCLGWIGSFVWAMTRTDR